MAGVSFSKQARRPRRRKVATSQPAPMVPHVLILARRLDMQADAELFLGHHAAAERLAHRAAQLRGWA